VRRTPSTDGVTVAAYDLGGDGPPLLFSHATGFHGHVWEPLAGYLADRFHCYSFDTRGHGRSTRPVDAGFGWRGFGADVLAAVDAFGLTKPFAVGHSAGAAALLMAEQDRHGTFGALYCFEPIVLPVTDPPGAQDNPLSEGALRRRAVFPSKEDAFENYAAKPPLSVLDERVLRAYVEHGFEELPDGTVTLRCRPEDEAEVYRMGFEHAAFARFGEVRCPVIVACGETTDAIGPDTVAKQAAALPDGCAEVLPGLGHFGPLEDPAAVADRIVAAFAPPA
jgi:pimeloyl-ACP methyl ester carboxylesterase